MLNETNFSSSLIAVMEEQQFAHSQNIGQLLKASAPRHPALNRVHAKLVASDETEEAISRYDRMHHRHSRS